jgi:methylthioribose-1-phosphate isomerase
MLDQRLLPHREVIRTYRDYRGVARAIQTMVIRGAPAIGVAAAMGMALAIRGNSGPHARARFDRAATLLMGCRADGARAEGESRARSNAPLSAHA